MADRKDVAVLREELNTATDVLNRTTERLTEANTELSLAQEKLTTLTQELAEASVIMNKAKKELEGEQTRLYQHLKMDISQVKAATVALEEAVSKLEEGTDKARQSVESLINK